MKHRIVKATKAIIEISIEEIFSNFVQSVGDLMKDQMHDDVDLERNLDLIKKLQRVIQHRDESGIKAFFAQGFTMMLLGDAFGVVDSNDVAEVIITLSNGDKLIIPNESIDY